MEEPAVKLEARDFKTELEGGEGNESSSGEKAVPDEPKGVPGTS